MTNTQFQSSRLYGLDLLRIFSTILIVTLHVFSFGGLIHSELDGNQPILWLIYIISFCGVDCYAIISGYVCYERKHRYSRIVSIWLQVEFYTIIETLIFSIFWPHLLHSNHWFKAIFPIVNEEYWYMTAYFVLFLLIPALNKLTKSLSNKYNLILLVCLIIIYMSLKSVLKIAFHIPVLSNVILLVVLYLLGAYLKKTELLHHLNWYHGVILFIIMIFGTFATRMMNCYMFINNDSPSISLAALGLFIIFISIKVKNERIINIIKFLSSSTMCVYLIHTNHLILNNVILIITAYTLNIFCDVEILGVILLILAIYFICTLLDKIRIILFESINSILKRKN